MATYSELGVIASQADFQSRVNYALHVGATNVHAEDPVTANHTVRKRFAEQVVRANVNIQSAALAVLTNSSIAAEADPLTAGNTIPDADIQFAVNSLWDLLSDAWHV